MSKPEVSLTNAEWAVMDAVWELAPVRARDVLDAVADRTGWSYSTVKTLLGRLVEKGALRESRSGNASVYEPLLTREQSRGGALRELVERAFGGALGSLVTHLVQRERLSKRDREALRKLLEAEDRAARERAR
ncbi:MAG: BlaI/MecI/CopY family transcriptional regulator [Planctomycetes bacterium]|nr:BlaI/MecI/CopY family transcriptional regulator [Planctomycetota bacterium]